MCPRGVLHQMFSTGIQHIITKSTQSDLRFCENEESQNLKPMIKGVNWIKHQEDKWCKFLKTVK